MGAKLGSTPGGGRLKPDLAFAVGEDVVARETLAHTLATATKGNKDERIFLRADKGVSYGEMMNLLRNAAYLKVALVGLDGRDAP